MPNKPLYHPMTSRKITHELRDKMEKGKLSLVRELLKNIFLINILERAYQSFKCSTNHTNSTIGHNLQTYWLIYVNRVANHQLF